MLDATRSGPRAGSHTTPVGSPRGDAGTEIPKPYAVVVRPDGTVKVLDFGLAKAMEPAAGSSVNMSMSQTLTTPAMTQAGMILGTAA